MVREDLKTMVFNVNMLVIEFVGLRLRQTSGNSERPTLASHHLGGRPGNMRRIACDRLRIKIVTANLGDSETSASDVAAPGRGLR